MRRKCYQMQVQYQVIVTRLQVVLLQYYGGTITSVQSPLLRPPPPSLQVPDPPFPPPTPSPSGRGASWHITLFLLNPCCHSDLTSSSFSLPAICSSFLLVPCFFQLRYSLNLLLSTDFDIHSTLFTFALYLQMSTRAKEGTEIQIRTQRKHRGSPQWV